jgi:serine/threonine protein kinase
VALKVLAPALVDETASRARFLRESQSGAAIDHPNIIPIYEVCEIDATFYSMSGDAVVAWGTSASPFVTFRMVDHGGDLESLDRWWVANRAEMVPCPRVGPR